MPAGSVRSQKKSQLPLPFILNFLFQGQGLLPQLL